MKNQFHRLRLVCAVAVVTMVSMAIPALAQQPAPGAAASSLQATLADDVGNLGGKFEGLARVMAGKYDWRPAQGVRSVGDVLNLIVNENRMLTGLLTTTPQSAAPGGRAAQPAPITDAALMQETLRSSYATLRQAVASLSASDLTMTVRMFGREMTKQSAVLLLLMDQHEHLGQSIAYARSNGVTPPWSVPRQ